METAYLLIIALLLIIILLLLRSKSRENGADPYRRRQDLPTNSAPLELDSELQARLLQLIAEEKKIKAIKELREATHLNLKDAKDFIDNLEKQHK
ncbi:ribosomal protein L7/L12 [Paenibacillus sp. GCM10027626]|uniref:ribosomal protein L7/L12 n=1 Tax=Paenibacillus sp. GCM10027626 TaxID=3273411 RepID=UPI00362F049F